MDAWLTAAADALACEAGLPVALAEGDATTLLDLARVAAHESGDRRNAPLLCYLLGLARATGRSLDELAATVPRSRS